MSIDPFVRLSLFMIHRRWAVVGIFTVVVLGGMVLFGSKATDVVVPTGIVATGSSSAEAGAILARDFHLDQENRGLLVFHSDRLTVDDPRYRGQVLAAASIVRRQPDVTGLGTYYDTHDPSLVSRDRRTSFVEIFLHGGERQVERTMADLPTTLTAITLPHYTSGRPAVAGDVTLVSEEDLHRAEFVTIPVVLILLLLVFRTVVAAIIPLILGVSAIAVTESAVDLVGSHVDVSVYALNVASIIGLGLGIDFALIIVSRYRQELERNPDVIDAISTTMATAGRSITYSGSIVIISMVILILIMLPLTIIRSMGMAILITAATALISALTLLPALLAILGHHIEALRIIPRRHPKPGAIGVWYRLSRQIMQRPWLWLGVSLLIMLAITSPIHALNLAGPNVANLPSSDSSVQGTKLLAQAFGPGYVSPIDIVVQTPPGGVLRPAFLHGVQSLTATLQADYRVQSVQSLSTIALAAGVPPASFSSLTTASISANPRLATAAATVIHQGSSGSDAFIQVIPRSSEYSAASESLTNDLRSSILPGVAGFAGAKVYIGGQTAELQDFSDAIYGRFPYVVIAIVLLVFVVLAMFFQSLFLPIKAVVLNLLSIVATYGALSAIFVWGVGDRLLGFHASGALNVVTPVILFAILFALSTDYEVFMLSRVKEHYAQTKDNTEAVAYGLQNTAGVITAAGLILMFTFGSFATASLVTVKEIGVGLAVGVLLDSTIVRVIMVPATMRLLGDRNWWMPAGMKRFLPELREGPAPVPVPGVSPAHSAPVADGAVDRVQDTTVPAVYLRPAGQIHGADRIALPISRPFRIGRDTSNDLQLFDKRVAGHHARLDYRDGRLFLTDLGSRHRVFLNSEPVRRHHRVAIQPGDLIQITGLTDHSFAVEAA